MAGSMYLLALFILHLFVPKLQPTSVEEQAIVKYIVANWRKTLNTISFEDLKEKVCVVTGGCGVFGGVFSSALVNAGEKVAIIDYKQGRRENCAMKLARDSGSGVVCAVANVPDRSSLLEAKEMIHNELGKTDILLNGAGGNAPTATAGYEFLTPENVGDLSKSFFGLDLDGFRSVFDLNFLGAVDGREQIMGRADTPIRQVLNYVSDNFAKQLPIVYVLTVVGKNSAGELSIYGLFIRDTVECFERAAELSLKVNFEMLEKPLTKVVVYLDPSEFKSTWPGNKSIYRTRMAIADGGELLVIAPGLSQFGEDTGIDALIRKYGYVVTPRVLELVKQNEELQQNLSTAAHLIHGSSEGRFTITNAPGNITQQEIESVNFYSADLSSVLERYNPATMKDGYNIMRDGEEVFYISNPALGLWATKERFITQTGSEI